MTSPVFMFWHMKRLNHTEKETKAVSTDDPVVFKNWSLCLDESTEA